jgi:hypothetical protein
MGALISHPVHYCMGVYEHPAQSDFTDFQNRPSFTSILL